MSAFNLPPGCRLSDIDGPERTCTNCGGALAEPDCDELCESCQAIEDARCSECGAKDSAGDDGLCDACRGWYAAERAKQDQQAAAAPVTAFAMLRSVYKLFEVHK